VGVAINIEKMCRVHLRIDLRRRQARVPEQFLERSQIGAAREQMRRKAVAKGVRGNATAGGQIEAEALDKTLDIP
jgi:hypothetical protein